MSPIPDSSFGTPRYAFRSDADGHVVEQVISEVEVRQRLRFARQQRVSPYYLAMLTPKEMRDGVIDVDTEIVFAKLN